MASEATARVLTPASRPQLRAVPGYGGGRPRGGGLIVSNARLGMIGLLAAESMMFFGLIGAYLVFRYGSATWPPPGQPHLPLLVTWVNTVVLLTSGLTMQGALRAARCGDAATLAMRLTITAALGVVFLLVQGSEWVGLIRHGLTLSSSSYGSAFYTLIGFHGLHVFGAVVWLLLVARGARQGKYTASQHVPVDLCSMYWTFVVGLWVLLFVLVYLR